MQLEAKILAQAITYALSLFRKGRLWWDCMLECTVVWSFGQPITLPTVNCVNYRVTVWLNSVSLAGRWWPNNECWNGSFVIFQRIRTSIAKKPYIFVIFQGRGSEPPPPLDPSMKFNMLWHSKAAQSNQLTHILYAVQLFFNCMFKHGLLDKYNCLFSS